MDKISIDQLRENLNDYSAHLQHFQADSNADSDSIILFDELAKYHHYMISDIIDYLDQL